jgi:hypothetical protein
MMSCLQVFGKNEEICMMRYTKYMNTLFECVYKIYEQRHGWSRFRLDTTRIKHGTIKAWHARHGVPYPCRVSFYHFLARHEKIIIKDTARYGTKARHVRTRHGPARHELRTLIAIVPLLCFLLIISY